MSAPNWLRRPSAITTAVVPVLLGLVGNLATNTVQISGVWTAVVWIVAAVLFVAAVLAELRPYARAGAGAKRTEQQRGQMSGRKKPLQTTGLHGSVVASVAGVTATLTVVAFFVVSCLTAPDAAPVARRIAGISCEIRDGSLALAISGRQGSPGFAMSPTVAQVVRAAIVHRDHVGPVTLVNVDGRPSVADRTGVEELRANPELAEAQVQRMVDAVSNAGAKIRARVPEVDVLSALDTAARANGPERSGTIVVSDSGLSTTGGVAFDDATAIDVAIDDLIEHVKVAGYMPDLSGMTVVFVGLGEVSAPQSPLRPAQRRHLVRLWEKIAQTAGAKCVATVDEVGHPASPAGVPEIRSVFVPPPPAASRPGTATSVVLSAGSELQFRDDSAKFEDEDAARQSLAPVLRLIAAYPDRHVHVTGTTANLGSREDQVRLSTARARAVADLLVELGVPENRITVLGVGSDFSEYVPDQGPDGRLLAGPAQQNRTVRIDLVPS